MGKRASAAGAKERATQPTRASSLAQQTRASARATMTNLGDELIHLFLSHVNLKYSESGLSSSAHVLTHAIIYSYFDTFLTLTSRRWEVYK